VKVAHLARRLAGSLSQRPPSAADEEWARSFLSPWERDLWNRFQYPDRRHAIEVARRFTSLRSGATRDEVAGALLHDIGKVESGLGTLGRVAATLVGARTDRFRLYHAHEMVGAQLLRRAGSSAVTVELVEGGGPAAPYLRAADDA
jgi:predicted HD phosphohydrolase